MKKFHQLLLLVFDIAISPGCSVYRKYLNGIADTRELTGYKAGSSSFYQRYMPVPSTWQTGLQK